MSTPRIWSLFLLFCELTGGEGAEKGWCAWPLPPSPLPVCMQVCVCSEEDEKDVDDVFLPSLPPSPHPSLPPSSVPHSGHACPENKGNSLGNHSCSSPHSPSLPPSPSSSIRRSVQTTMMVVVVVRMLLLLLLLVQKEGLVVV